MLRTFDTHKVRVIRELSGRLWDFTPLEKGTEQIRGKIMVTGCLETCPGFESYRGWVKYETTFEAGGNVRLEFKGVSHFAKVFVDGGLLTEHYGSYTPFDICIRSLKPGIHTLEVLVDNAFRDEYALDMPNDYMSYGGISRGVLLEEVPGCYLKYIHMTPVMGKNGRWMVDIEVACENLLDEECIRNYQIRIAGTEIAAGEQRLQPGVNRWRLSQLPVGSVETWCPENPTLYFAEALLLEGDTVTDDWIDRIGFRTVSVEGKKVLLNGRPIRIKGFCRHEDHPHYGCAIPPQAIAADLQLIRDMGGNSIRTVHYPNDEIFLDMCDELGLLVWEENHARGIDTEHMRHPLFEKQCEQVIREMITTHYNHPSIYIWGILNECGSESEYGRSCYQAQYNLIRQLDQSRICSSASCRFGNDICQDLPDVCSWNIYPYWYEDISAAGKIQELLLWLAGKGYGNKPFLITEIGAGAIYGFRDTAHDVWSEELQADILEKQLRELMACEDCIGAYIWQFCDVRVSRIDWAIRRPKSRNNKGIVDEYRRPKLAYQVVKDIYNGLPDYFEEK